MASSKEYLTYVLELLREVKGITYRKMMGEYVFYKDNVVFGGLYDNRFLIKITNSINDEEMKKVIPYPSAKEMFLIDSEDPDEIKELVTKVYRDLTK